MTLALTLLVMATVAQPAATFAPSVTVTRDEASGRVRQLSALRVPVAEPSLAGLVRAFFEPYRAELGLDPAELVEVRREAWTGGTSVVLQRVIDGHEVVDGVVRVTLGRDGAVEAYTAGDVAPVTRATAALAAIEAATAAGKVLTGLGQPAASDLVYLGGRLSWRLRYAPSPARSSASAGGLAATYAPIVFVDAVSGEVLALRNGLVR